MYTQITWLQYYVILFPYVHALLLYAHTYVYYLRVCATLPTYIPMYGLKVMLLFYKNNNVYKHVIVLFLY